MLSHCTINKSANLYTNLPVTVFVCILANDSIKIIFEPNNFPMQHIGPAVWAPVVTINFGLILIYRNKDLKQLYNNLKG